MLTDIKSMNENEKALKLNVNSGEYSSVINDTSFRGNSDLQNSVSRGILFATPYKVENAKSIPHTLK